MISAFLFLSVNLRFKYSVFPLATSATSSAILSRSIFLILGSLISSTNGLPVPNILTSMSSLPAPWNLASYPFVCFKTVSDRSSSTDSGYCFPVKLHSSQPLPLHLVHGHFVWGMPLTSFLYLPSIKIGLIWSLTFTGFSMSSFRILLKSAITRTSSPSKSTFCLRFASSNLPISLLTSFLIISTLKSRSSLISWSFSTISLGNLQPTTKVSNSTFKRPIFSFTKSRTSFSI